MSMEMDMNRVLLSGKILSEPQMHHELYGEAFFTAQIAVTRLSGVVDSLPLMLPGRLIRSVEEGMDLSVEGQLRSYRRLEQTGVRLQLFAFVRSVLPPAESGTNEVELIGCLIRNAEKRRTPLGREITDLLLAASRAHGKKDCIPCIAWGRHATDCDGLEAGARMRILGRMQSRSYQKQLSDGSVEDRVTYEVSVGSIYGEEAEQ